MNNLKIQEHQLIPIEYIVSKEPEQHGLVLNHYMGTGKTLTAAFLFKNYPNNKKFVILPEGLENQWINEFKRVGLDEKEITFITYNTFADIIFTNDKTYKKKFNNFFNQFNDSIVILDESHIFIDIIDDMQYYAKHMQEHLKEPNHENKIRKQEKPFNIYVEMINFFKKIKKIIFMSGTISIQNFNQYINLCAGKTLVNWNTSTFLSKYKLQHGIFIKRSLDIISLIIKKNPIGIFSDDQLAQLTSIIKGVDLDTYLQKPNGVQKELKNLNLSNFLEKDIYNISSTRIINKLNKIYEDEKDKSKYISSFNENKIKNYVKYLALNQSEKDELNENFYKFKNDIRDSDVKLKESRIFFVNSIISSILFFELPEYIFKKIKQFLESRFGFIKLDYNKLKKDGLNKYFSFYKYVENIEFYPTFDIKINRVNFTNEQLRLISKILVGIDLTPEEYYTLGFAETLEEAEIYTKKIIYEDEKNLQIGNLYDEPEKFKSIIEIYKKNPESTVIWSNFYENGILKMAKYLDKNKISYKIYEPKLSNKRKEKILQDFKNKKINLILLHPSFYQGFSVLGCRNFHILEPVKSISKKDQLLTRAIRFKSHAHLPINQRNVQIYIWGCSLGQDIIRNISNKSKNLKKFLSTYFKHLYLDQSLELFLKNFYNIISIDDNFLMTYEEIEIKNNYYEKTIKEISIDNNKLSNTCCIWNPEGVCHHDLKPCYLNRR